jgi:hypothetical protein
MLLSRIFFFTKSLKIPKGFIRSCKLEKDRHHNDQRKNDKKKPHIVVENTMHRELKRKKIFLIIAFKPHIHIDVTMNVS